ncbi:NAD(P)-dependent oxidoreductase [Aliihoeflea sp. 2WW]|uniref:NAD-dependent epimerase/dehydratase family protein n=1 Tax=Aliihoeflea sp. 2WW TaxID=1381123 RepID=UPI000465DD11|nr:NAD(P)-dependent oxidoreductase [Aliihoeflea sp. 2WW]
MTRVLVTGGTGYVGRFIVERLLADGEAVTVFGRNRPPPGLFSKPVDFVAGDLEPRTFRPENFSGFDAVVHAAFHHLPRKYRGGEGDDPKGFVLRNRDGSIALFEAAKQAGVSRVIFLSTRAVYGPKAPGTALNEDTPATPDTLYGKVKRDAEQALLAMMDGDFAATVLRVTGVYGPAGPGRRHKWADLFDDYLAGKEIAPRAGTEVHGEDVAAAIRIALDGPTPAILNVSDLMVDRHDLLAIVKAATGVPNPLPGRADASAINEMDCARLKSLGWTPGGRPLLERTIRALLA